MKLSKVPATETTPNSIDLYTDNGNLFANINLYGTLSLIGEDCKVWSKELKEISVIADNFELFFSNINHN